jgi:hypothetical protein
MLARQIERQMHRAGKDCALYGNEHCALSERDLQHICPRNDKDRKKKLAEFAAQYGFRLRFYREGLFAIFGKRTPVIANDGGCIWPS